MSGVLVMNWNDFVAEHGKPWITNKIEVDKAWVLMTIGTEACGWVRWEPGWEMPVLGLVVHPISRGMGLGSLLIRLLEDVVFRYTNKLRLHVNPLNTAALSIYLNRGYVKTGERDDGEWILVKTRIS